MPELQKTKSGRFKNLRASDEDTELSVPEKTQTYRDCLYAFNFVLTGIGLTMISMGVVMMVDPEHVLMPQWLVIVLFVFGFSWLILGAIAARGAVLAKKLITSGLRNWYLYIFTLVMTLFLLFEFGMACVIVIESLNVENEEVTGVTGEVVYYLEDSLIDELEDSEEVWWEWQKTWECCGWENNTIPAPLATGKFCTTDVETSAEPCKGDLEDYILENSIIMISLGSAFFVSQLCICCSACQLGCFIQAEENIVENRHVK